MILAENKIPQQQEVLSLTDSYNEYIMTRLRTKFGVNSEDIHRNFGKLYEQHFIKEAQIFLENGQIEKRDSGFHISEKGKFLSDGIAAELFYLNNQNFD